MSSSGFVSLGGGARVGHGPTWCAAAVFTFCLAAIRADAQLAFTDQTVAASLNVVHQPSITCIGPNYHFTGGMAAADFNNDGWQDVFWIGGGLTPDRLFINDGDGTFTDQAAAWGIAVSHGGVGASAADYDQDGFVDLYVTSYGNPFQEGQPGKHKLYHNNGNGAFTDVAVAAGVNFSSPTSPAGHGSGWGDYDLDGDLDLCVGSWMQNSNGNVLYRNNGDGTFTNVTSAAVGTAFVNVWGFQPSFVDMNGDLYPELLLAADFETSRYLVNNGDGTFTDMTVASGTGLDDEGMGQAVADVNNDGLFDWYVTSVYQDMPQRGDYIGNTLYINLGNDLYDEVAMAVGVADGGWGWGTVAADFDHDGWLDLAEVNGRPGGGEWTNEQEYLYYNNGDGTFTEIAQAAGFTLASQGTALLAFDADHDGDKDLAAFVNHCCPPGPSWSDGQFRYYRNDTPDPGNWLYVTLDASTNPLLPPNGFGSKLTAVVGDTEYHRFMDGGPSYLATSESNVHFGLGTAQTIDQVRVTWSRGYVTVLSNVAVNQYLTVTAPALADLNANGVVNASDLALLLGRWGPVTDSSDLIADINNNGVVNASDLALLLGSWG